MMIITVVFAQFSAYASEAVPEVFSQRETKYNDMVAHGVSHKDALFILDFEDALGKSPDKITIDDDVVVMPKSLSADKSTFRGKLLQLDKSAIKRGLMAEVSSNGMTDLNALMQSDPNRLFYRIDYDDGSFISARTIVKRVDIAEASYATTNAYSETIVAANQYYDGNWDVTYEMTQFTGVSYSKNSIQVKWTQDNTDNGTPDGTYSDIDVYFYRGLQAAAGLISISNSGENVYRDNAAGIWFNSELTPTTNPAYIDNEVVFTTSGSLTLGGVFSVTISNSWTQSAAIKIYGDGIVHKVASIYY